jgi:hypothetical protein
MLCGRYCESKGKESISFAEGDEQRMMLYGFTSFH